MLECGREGRVRDLGGWERGEDWRPEGWRGEGKVEDFGEGWAWKREGSHGGIRHLMK